MQFFARPPATHCEYNDIIQECFNEIHKATHSPSTLLDILPTLPPDSFQLHVKQICNIQRWQRDNGVTIFPSSDLVEKCLHTDALSTVAGSDIRVTYPSILFTLPRHHAFQLDNSRIGHLLVTIFDEHESLHPILNSRRFTCLRMERAARHLLINAFWDINYTNTISCPLSDKPIEATLEWLYQHHIADTARAPASTAEIEETLCVGQWATPLVINFLLLMQSYPNYIQQAEPRHQRAAIYRDRPRPLSLMLSDPRPLCPSTVGPPHPHDTVPATSIHRRMHWRRGHWRRQPHTQAWLDAAILANNAPTEIILPDGRHAHMAWIRPVLVNKDQPHEDQADQPQADQSQTSPGPIVGTT